MTRKGFIRRKTKQQTNQPTWHQLRNKQQPNRRGWVKIHKLKSAHADVISTVNELSD